MNAYEAMGCEPTWTCAPYQMDARSDSARSPGPNRTPSSSPTQCSVPAPTATEISSTSRRRWSTGRRPPPRHGTPRHDRLRRLCSAAKLLDLDVAYPVIGHSNSKLVGSAVPVIVGAPAGLSEDRLKRSGAGHRRARWPCSMSSAPFEAPTSKPCGGRVDRPSHDHRRRSSHRPGSTPDLDQRDSARSAWGHPTTPCRIRSADRTARRPPDPPTFTPTSTPAPVSPTNSTAGWSARLADAGVQLVTDTCTYITPVMADIHGTAMTDSASGPTTPRGTSAWMSPSVRSRTVSNQRSAARWSSDEGVWADAARRTLIAGEAHGEILDSTRPLSFWGGFNRDRHDHRSGPPRSSRLWKDRHDDRRKQMLRVVGSRRGHRDGTAPGTILRIRRDHRAGAIVAARSTAP